MLRIQLEVICGLKAYASGHLMWDALLAFARFMLKASSSTPWELEEPLCHPCSLEVACATSAAR